MMAQTSITQPTPAVGQIGPAPVQLPSGRRPSLPGWLWEHHRPKILELYLGERTLSEVAEIMREEEGFDATEQMYKKRLSSWGITKYHKYTDEQKLYMIRKVLRRYLDGKPTSFKRHDDNITRDEAKNLKRVLQRGMKDVDQELIERFNQIQLDKHSESGVVRHASTCSSRLSRGSSLREADGIPGCMLKRFDSGASRYSFTPYTPITASRNVSLRVPGAVRYASDREDSTDSADIDVQVEIPTPAAAVPFPPTTVSFPPQQAIPSHAVPRPISESAVSIPTPSPQSPPPESPIDLLFLPELEQERLIESHLSQKYPSSNLSVMLSRREDNKWGRSWASVTIHCADCDITIRKTVPVMDGTGSEGGMVCLWPMSVRILVKEVYDEHLCLPWHEENVRKVALSSSISGSMSPAPPNKLGIRGLGVVVEEGSLEPPELFVSAAVISPPLPLPLPPVQRHRPSASSSSSLSSSGTSSTYNEVEDTPPTTAGNTFPMSTPDLAVEQVDDWRFSWQPVRDAREYPAITVATLRDLAEASRALERNGVALKRPGTASSERSDMSVRSVRRQRKVDCFGNEEGNRKGNKKQRRV